MGRAVAHRPRELSGEPRNTGGLRLPCLPFELNKVGTLHAAILRFRFCVSWWRGGPFAAGSPSSVWNGLYGELIIS